SGRRGRLQRHRPKRSAWRSCAANTENTNCTVLITAGTSTRWRHSNCGARFVRSTVKRFWRGNGAVFTNGQRFQHRVRQPRVAKRVLSVRSHFRRTAFSGRTRDTLQACEAQAQKVTSGQPETLVSLRSRQAVRLLRYDNLRNARQAEHFAGPSV